VYARARGSPMEAPAVGFRNKWSRLHKRVKIDLTLCNILRLFNLGVICYEIKNGRHFLVWLATWGGSLPGQLRYSRFGKGWVYIRNHNQPQKFTESLPI
jgi:hypothetical protein